MTPHWSEVLPLRDELLGQRGQISDLQMSLFAAAYQTRDVPYRDVDYYSSITEPTPGLVGFMADVARRLGTKVKMKAAWHLDQGMGGGKSHALVGLYHMTNSPKDFFNTELGRAVQEEARERSNEHLMLEGARVVVLSADNMTPGVATPEFGPATTLHQRFLWSLFQGNRRQYEDHVKEGIDKNAIKKALDDAGSPVLILLDELMDYALALSDESHIGGMPSEQVFLAALTDAVDDTEVARAALVVVMIRSDLDERGYTPEAEALRDYIAARLAERSGVTVAVTEAQDFSSIIRRRIFESSPTLPVSDLAEQWIGECSEPWEKNVFSKLPAGRSLSTFRKRLEVTYPFHPDLMELVSNDWSRHAGFQRVRSTVEIFALTAFYWAQENKDGRWSPPLIGLGDIPLHYAIEHVLSSGLLHGNDKAIQGFRQVAAADIVTKDRTQGRSVETDHRLLEERPDRFEQPNPSERLATALFLYSLVNRAQGRRGASKSELMSAIYIPDRRFTYGEADEVFSILTGDEEGLGALEVIQGGGGTATRFLLTVSQTLRMFYRQAKQIVQNQPQERDQLIWERVNELAKKGSFDEVVPIAEPSNTSSVLQEIFGEVDEQTKNRLVVLDPRRWNKGDLANGTSEEEIRAIFGLGESGLRVDYAASCVVACGSLNRRDTVRKRASEAMAFQVVRSMLDPADELLVEADHQLGEARARLDQEIQRAYQNFAFLVRAQGVVDVEWGRFDEETRTALSGNHIWDALVERHRATRSGGLSGQYLKAVLDLKQRNLTLKEVVRKFWQDPTFPLVPSLSDVRKAIFEAIKPPVTLLSSAASEAWEIVDAEGNKLTVASPDQLAVNSMDQYLRVAVPAETEKPVEEEESTETSTEPGVKVETRYMVYTVELSPRSLTQRQVRDRIWRLLSAIADRVDATSNIDIQLAEMKIKLTAPEGTLRDIQQRVEEAEARWTVEEEGL